MASEVAEVDHRLLVQGTSSRPTKCLRHGCLMQRREGPFGIYWACAFGGAKNHCSIQSHISRHDKLWRFSDAETRRARTIAHQEFDRLWQHQLMDRTAAYTWLAESMQLSKRKCHIKHFTVEACNAVVQLSRAKFEELRK